MKAKCNEASSYEILRAVRWPKGVVCPYCEQTRVTTHTKSALTPRRRYLCLGCRRTFSDLTGTPFARTNLPLGTWFFALWLMEERLVTSELAKELEVKWDTAILIQRRLNSPGLVGKLSKMVKEVKFA